MRHVLRTSGPIFLLRSPRFLTPNRSKEDIYSTRDLHRLSFLESLSLLISPKPQKPHNDSLAVVDAAAAAAASASSLAKEGTSRVLMLIPEISAP